LRMLLRIGREFGVAAVRLPLEPPWFAAQDGRRLAWLGGALLAPWNALMKRRLRAARVLHNDHLFGVAASGAMDEQRLLAVLARLPPGITEIYLHPATLSGAAIAASMSGYRHADELAALLSPRVRDAIAAAGIHRGGYVDALRARA
jgi:chitin disaccharide deacetylase